MQGLEEEKEEGKKAAKEAADKKSSTDFNVSGLTIHITGMESDLESSRRDETLRVLHATESPSLAIDSQVLPRLL